MYLREYGILGGGDNPCRDMDCRVDGARETFKSFADEVCGIIVAVDCGQYF
jgi:hypothetical protein